MHSDCRLWTKEKHSTIFSMQKAKAPTEVKHKKEKKRKEKKKHNIDSSSLPSRLHFTLTNDSFPQHLYTNTLLEKPINKNFPSFSPMDSHFPNRNISQNGSSSCPCTSLFPRIIKLVLIIIPFLTLTSAQSNLCRTSCGDIPINYPFGIDDGCGSPYYRHILVCSSDSRQLLLRTPSGRYPIRNISYSDPHILITDPFMWTCQDGDNFRPTRPFSLDTSIRLSLSPQNDYLFFNCSENNVIIEPKPIFCERFPEKCDSSCDSAGYLCRHLPECGSEIGGGVFSGLSCCSYSPKATESLRLMLKYCSSYTSVYWRNVGASVPYDQVPEYGIRIDFELPVTTRCLQCQDTTKGGGRCGFDTRTQSFLCLCEKGNVTTYCQDHENSQHHGSVGVIAGTASAFSVAGVLGIGGGVWYLRKIRANAPVSCGVETNENRLY